MSDARTPLNPVTDAATLKEGRGSIQVIDRMMSLIEAMAAHEEPVGLKQIAAEVGLHPSTAHRILGAIAASGLVERSENGSYRLGIRFLQLGNIVKSRISVREIALPFMLELHAITGESVNLGMRDHDDIVYVERTSSGRSAVRVVHIVGARAPLHTTATGKLFLADDGPAKTADYAKRTGLPAATSASITTLAALEAALVDVRSTQLAYDIEEVENGVRCIAAGIRDDAGVLQAGLSLSTPSERFNPQWAQLVLTAANKISSALGHTPSTMRYPSRLRA